MLTPTIEQQAIIDAAKGTSDNLLVNALAGAAKTSTLQMICERIQGIPILSLAFNRRIADEMVKRLPSHVECRTMNSLGHRVWSAAIGRRLIVNPNKTAEILKAMIAERPKGGDQTQAWEEFADTLAWLRRAKQDGYVPYKWKGLAKFSMDYEVWLEKYDEGPTAQQEELIAASLSESIEQSYKGMIDFDDQVMMPVCFGAMWPKFPLVLVDEAQDLNELQHEMLKHLVVKRIIAVGDPWQSIYLFRGAKSNSMAALQETFNMKELGLSVTFRVPQSGVIRARSRVPHMQWPKQKCETCEGKGSVRNSSLADNIEPYITVCRECNGSGESWPVGNIQRLANWNESSIPDGAAIICRNNAPLLSCALKLLSRGRAIKLVGMESGPSLLRIMRKLAPLDSNHEQMSVAIAMWTKEELKKGKKNTGIINDRAECLQVLCSSAPTLREAITRTEMLFKRDGLIQLMSGHKSKGLEYDTVFHLDSWRIPSKYAKIDTEQYEQELNVRYVIETRFKKELILADMEGFR